MGKEFSRSTALSHVKPIANSKTLSDETKKLAADIQSDIGAADEAYNVHTDERENVETARSELTDAESELTNAKTSLRQCA